MASTGGGLPIIYIWIVMFLSGFIAIALLAGARSTAMEAPHSQQNYGKITPKVVIVSMFYPEADVWYRDGSDSVPGNLLANNVSVPGLSPLYPNVHCNEQGDVCQITVGESEINAAATMTAFVLSGLFDLAQTYFLLAGIAGINPKLGTLGSVALSRFSVQVALQYEIDAREMPANFSTGYLPFGSYTPNQYPSIIYGTEVMEVNQNLRDAAVNLAQRAKLVDSAGIADYRAEYSTADDKYAAATNGPSILGCDSATSDVYYSGTLLSEGFENTTKLWTNQSSITYCVTAQEDGAILQALMRGTIWGRVDFSRAIVMRTGSDFDRPPPSTSAFQHLRLLDQNGFDVAIQNLYLAGMEIVKGIVADWDPTYSKGIKPTNYIGDIVGTLGGEPDFGFGSLFNGVGFTPLANTYVNLVRRGNLMGRRAGGWK
ncbi:putative purine nucleoside permease [Hypoxylon sp. NC1633]|nr:putative purine nucleoside permease [Hypoxylon sp. NC1633]